MPVLGTHSPLPAIGGLASTPQPGPARRACGAAQAAVCGPPQHPPAQSPLRSLLVHAMGRVPAQVCTAYELRSAELTPADRAVPNRREDVIL